MLQQMKRPWKEFVKISVVMQMMVQMVVGYEDLKAKIIVEVTD